MKFPFTFKHIDKNFYVDEGVQGNVIMRAIETDWVAHDFPQDDLERCIKEGVYIVTSAPAQTPAEPPTSPASKSDVHTIKINIEPIEEATEALNKLAEAAEAAKVAIDNLKLSFD